MVDSLLLQPSTSRLPEKAVEKSSAAPRMWSSGGAGETKTPQNRASCDVSKNREYAAREILSNDRYETQLLAISTFPTPLQSRQPVSSTAKNRDRSRATGGRAHIAQRQRREADPLATTEVTEGLFALLSSEAKDLNATTAARSASMSVASAPSRCTFPILIHPSAFWATSVDFPACGQSCWSTFPIREIVPDIPAAPQVVWLRS
jgi:hypothetical protein